MRNLPFALLALSAPSAALAQANPSAFTTAYRYDADHRLTGTIEADPDGAGPLHYAAIRNTYDTGGRLTRVEKGELANWQADTVAPADWTGFTILETIDATFDGSDRKLSETVSAGGAAVSFTQTSYDNVGRVDCVAVRMNAPAFGSQPAACSLGTQGSFGPDRITHNVYDAASQLLKVQKAYGTSLQQDYATYEYTLNGKQKAATDANGNRAELTWDAYDRQQRWIFPSPSGGGVANQADYEEYGYDAAGNRTSLRKRDGVTITYGYDPLNRVAQKNVPASASGAQGYSVFTGYDNRGLEAYARFGSASGPGIASSYDNAGRLTSSISNMGGVSRTLTHGYDADGNRVQVTHPDGHYFPYGYDGLDRLTSIGEDGAATLATFSYDSAGRHMGTGYTGASSSYGYDGVGRLSSLGHDLAGTTADQALTFGYNPASQMVTRTASNDALASNTAYNVGRAYSVNGLNQYTAAGTASFTYDANGNLISDGTNSYVYDAENRLVSRSGGIALAYDPSGRLFQTSGGSAGTTQFLYDGDELIAEYNSGGTMVQRYVHGNGEDDPLIWYDYTVGGYRRGLFTDHHGSIIAASDMYGNPVGTNAYDAWGIPNSTSTSTVGRFGYTGQAWLPDLGMWYYKARIYSPTLGRFLQTDPVGYKDQMNLYGYLADDPVDGRDPKGLYRCWDSTACDLYEKGKAALLKSISILERSKSERDRSVAAIQRAALADIGERGVDNGVNVASSLETDAAQWNSDTKTFEINTSAIQHFSDAKLAGVVGHEGTHEVQDRAGMITRNTMLSIERQAYTNQAVIQHSLGNNDLWSKANSDVDRTKVGIMARLSCKADVGQDHWSACR